MSFSGGLRNKPETTIGKNKAKSPAGGPAGLDYNQSSKLIYSFKLLSIASPNDETFCNRRFESNFRLFGYA